MRLLAALTLASLLCACGSSDSEAPAGAGSAGTAGAAAGAGGAGGAGAGAAAGASGTGGAGSGGAAGTGGTGGTGGQPGDTWTSFGKGFAATYCVECHAAGNAKRDYTTIADVKRDAKEIACGVATTKLAGCASFPPPKQFPIDNATKSNPKPDDAARDRFVAWVQAGTPE